MGCKKVVQLISYSSCTLHRGCGFVWILYAHTLDKVGFADHLPTRRQLK